jgi:dTDP-glucose 4,6-dehydratase
MNLLITGGAGFIGSNFIKYMLANSNHNIINIDKLTYAGNLDNLKEITDHKNYKFIKGDICNQELIKQVVDYNIDMIINFAAESHVDRSLDNPNLFFKTNVLGTQMLLDAAVENDIKKFIQISTDEVYGPGQEGEFHTEEDALSPTNPYAASKASADLLVLSYQHTYGLPINITRSTNNYGPYQYPEKIIPLFITNLLENKKVPLYGDGQHIRDWLHVKDHCKAIDLIIDKGKAGEIYNISSNNRFKNIELTKKILTNLNKSKDNIEYVKDRQGHDRAYFIDSYKIKKQLNWQPEYDFMKGLKETIHWYKNNKKWWDKLKK